MNVALEFHDSEVAGVRAVAETVRLELRPAYIHRSSGTPGRDAGEVFLQPAEVVFSSAVHSEAEGPCIGALSDGIITVNGKPFSNMVPVPFRESGDVVASFTFVSGGVLSISGSAVSCVTSGDGKFLEKYDG